MANIKFSAFTTETDDTQIDFLAGYQGTTMKKIAPANLSGSYPFLISSTSLYSGSLAPSLVGTPASNTTLSQNNMALTTGEKNTFIGATCGFSTTVGEQNVSIGNNSLRNGEEASKNIAIGSGALQNLNPPLTGSAFDTFNIAIGFNAGNDITEGTNNVIIGGNAGDVLTTGTRNTAMGHNALSAETTGGYNTAIGLNALQDLVAGTNAYNTAVGSQSLKDCTTGEKNTAVGAQIADTLLTGSNNTFLGYNAEPSSSSVDNEITLGDANVNSLRIPGLQSGASDGDVLTFSSGTGNITLQAGGGGGGATSLNGLSDVLIDGTSAYFINIPAGLTGNPINNLVIGDNAGTSLTDGFGNVLIGHDAGDAITTGDYIVAIGVEAGSGHTSNSRSVYIGYQAAKLVSAAGSVVVGERALDALSGSWNNHTVVGSQACTSTSSNSGHVAFGYQALNSQTSGEKNTAIGFECLELLTTSDDNVALGFEAGDKVTGAQNTLIGSSAGSSGTNDLTSGDNNILIGYQAAATSATVDNEITLGNSSIATLRCQVTSITALSDKRDKENIQASNYGLNVVDKLKPVTFNWNTRDGAKVGVKDLGFIAQDLQEVDNENLKLVYDNNPEKLEASYGRLVPVLVKAIQELKAEIELLKSKQ